VVPRARTSRYRKAKPVDPKSARFILAASRRAPAPAASTVERDPVIVGKGQQDVSEEKHMQNLCTGTASFRSAHSTLN